MMELYMSREVKDRYDAICSGQYEGLKNLEDLYSTEEAILHLISEYNASKTLQMEQEYEYNKLQVEYDNKLHDIKQKHMNEGAKSTEAKEKAKQELTPQQEELLKYEKDITILKANTHSIEHRLRLKFLQLQGELLDERKEEAM